MSTPTPGTPDESGPPVGGQPPAAPQDPPPAPGQPAMPPQDPSAVPGQPPAAPQDPPPAPGQPSGPWASDNLPQHPMAYAPRPDVPQPTSILQAVRLMFVGAAISAVGVLLSFTQTDAIREAVEDSDSSLTSSEVDTVVNVAVGFAAVFGLIGVGLWIWMAVTNGQGKSWARVVATVLGGLNILGTLFNLTQPGSTPLSLVLAVVGLILAAVILFLLYRPESSRYYEAKSG